MNFVEGKVKGVPLNFHRSDSPLNPLKPSNEEATVIYRSKLKLACLELKSMN